MNQEEEEIEEFIDPDDIQEEYELEEQQIPADDEDIEMKNVEIRDDSIQGWFGHNEPVYCIEYHPTNPIVVASGGGDDKSYIWATDTGEKLFDLATHCDSVSSIAFSFDGTYIASGGLDGKVFIFKVETGELLQSLEGPNEVVVSTTLI
jgi:ribosome assembly protein SQT1